jgi:hypothetical protein
MLDAVVLDAECFVLLDGDLEPKEVSIAAVEDGHVRVQTFILRPRVSFSALPITIQASNNYCTQRLHKISWNSGFIEKEHVCSILKRDIGSKQVFAKGDQKARMFSIWLRIPVYELGKLLCPKIKHIHLRPKYACRLPQHRNAYEHCAQVKAQGFAGWLQIHSCGLRCLVGSKQCQRHNHNGLCPLKLRIALVSVFL